MPPQGSRIPVWEPKPSSFLRQHNPLSRIEGLQHGAKIMVEVFVILCQINHGRTPLPRKERIALLLAAHGCTLSVSAVNHGFFRNMFIRTTEKPDVPFYTVEVDLFGKIVQVRGQRNCKTTPEVQAFIEEYEKHLAAVLGKEKRRKSA